MPLLSVLSRRLGPAGGPGLARWVHSIDMTQPHKWYPSARAMKRRVVCHVGPTNSGKTFTALQSLKQAKRGLYCGPLRLLAWEVCNFLRAEGVRCDLVTGQELERSDNSTHTACTIEMTSVEGGISSYDCAVIDEFQLIGDEHRGWAWSRAFLGLLADEIHVCGCPSFVPLLRKLCVLTGDDLQVHEYERLLPLVPSERAMRSYKNIRDGDCIVAFSRKEIHKIKSMVERMHPDLKCYVVYGNLPPEARKEQARLFNHSFSSSDQGTSTRDASVDGRSREEVTTGTVLIASDAIGMGLNLSIKRIVMSTLRKFDGDRLRVVTVSELKQIAGRAGRYFSGSSAGEHYGEVTCLRPQEHGALQRLLEQRVPDIETAGLFPSVSQLELLQLFLDMHPSPQLLSEFWTTYNTKTEEGSQPVRKHLDKTPLFTSVEVVEHYFFSIEKFRRELEKYIIAHSNNQRLKKLIRRSREIYAKSNGHKGRKPLHQVLGKFWDQCRLDDTGTYVLCNLEEKIELCKVIKDLVLPFRDRCTFIMAPVSVGNDELIDYFHRYALDYSLNIPVKLNYSVSGQNDGPAASATELLDLETSHQIVEAYIWLSYRFPGRFPDRELAVAECEEAVELISESLRDVTFSRHSPWEEDEEDRPPMAPEQRRNQRIRSGANNRSKGRYVVDYSRSKKGAFRRTSIA